MCEYCVASYNVTARVVLDKSLCALAHTHSFVQLTVREIVIASYVTVVLFSDKYKSKYP